MNKINFFERVYQVVRKIPEGKVMTYGQIADALGTRDARRVGQALHANKNSSDVPCHRVVRSDGTVGGYAWGTKRKEKLLRKEKAIS